jgi:hypothetical protein
VTETETKTSDHDVEEAEDTTTDEATQDDSAEDEPDDDGRVSEPVDQGPALRAGGTLNIGLCHFGGEDEPASILATREDGTGWIAVCEQHTKEAEEQGFVLEEESKRQSTDKSEKETQEPTEEELQKAQPSGGSETSVDSDDPAATLELGRLFCAPRRAGRRAAPARAPSPHRP